MLDHLIQKVIGFIRMSKLHNFNFVELVQAIQASHIFTITACFTSKARSVPAKFDGQLAFFYQGISVDVGQGHFSRRNHVQFVVLHVVHLAFFVGQLSRAKATVRIDHQRWNVFCVAGFVCFLQEKLNEPSLEFSSLPFVERKARSSNLGAQFKVNEIHLFRKFPVRLGMFLECFSTA